MSSPSSSPSGDRDHRYTPSPIARPRSNSTLSPIAESQAQPHFQLRSSVLSPLHSHSSLSPMSMSNPIPGSPTAHARERSAPLPSSCVRVPTLAQSRPRGYSQSRHGSDPNTDFSIQGCERAPLLAHSLALLRSRQQSAENTESSQDDSVDTTSTVHTSDSSIEIISCTTTSSDRQGSFDTRKSSGHPEASQAPLSPVLHLIRPLPPSPAPSVLSPSHAAETNSTDEDMPRSPIITIDNSAKPKAFNAPPLSAHTSPFIPSFPSPASVSTPADVDLPRAAIAHAMAPSLSGPKNPPTPAFLLLASAATPANDEVSHVPFATHGLGISHASMPVQEISRDPFPNEAQAEHRPRTRTRTRTNSYSQHLPPRLPPPTQALPPPPMSQPAPIDQAPPAVAAISNSADTPPATEMVPTTVFKAPLPTASIVQEKAEKTASSASAEVEKNKTPNVYINGLPPHFPDESLYLMTKEFGGVVSVRTFTRHVGERLSGYGFVLFETVESAEKCIESLRRYRNLHPSFSKQVHKIPGTTYSSSSNHGDADGLVPSWRRDSISASSIADGSSKSVTSSEAAASFRARMEQLKDYQSTNLYIEGLPLSIDEVTLSALVSPHAIKSSRFFQTKLSNPPRIIAFVRFETREAAEEIIERLHGRVVRGWNDNGSRISVRFADSNEQRELRRAERMARGEEEDPSPNRISMAHAALLNMRGAQAQAQAQMPRKDQPHGAKANLFLSPRGTASSLVDDFGRISSTSHKPLHPHAFIPNVPTSSLGANSIGSLNTDPTQQYNHQFAQAQEYARLLESTVREIGMSLSDMDLGAATSRLPNSPGMPHSLLGDTQMQGGLTSGGTMLSAADHFAYLQNQHYLGLLQQQQAELQRQTHQNNVRTQSLMPSLDIQTGLVADRGRPPFAQFPTNTRPFSTQQQQQQYQTPHRRQQHQSMFQHHQQSVDIKTCTGDRQQDFDLDRRASMFGTRSFVNSDSQRFLSKYGSQFAQDNADTPQVSPALTYNSRTPSTLSPATPFFGSFTPAPAQNDRRKAELFQ